MQQSKGLCFEHGGCRGGGAGLTDVTVLNTTTTDGTGIVGVCG